MDRVRAASLFRSLARIEDPDIPLMFVTIVSHAHGDDRGAGKGAARGRLESRRLPRVR